jgi:anti-sigma factor RsiW
MTCQEARRLLDAHADRELDPSIDREVADHLERCEECAREMERIRALKAAVKDRATYLQAPDALHRRIEAAIRASTPDMPADRAPARRNARWVSVVAPAAIAAILALVLAPRIFQSHENDFLLREVVAAHVRATQVDHLTDVASSDRHTVKPWFEGKIDFSPPVADFQAEGFKLVGGRVDYLDARAVAALVYQHGPHFINVFIWPTGERDHSPALATRNGYNIDHFTRGGMNYWIVSDTGRAEVQTLAALLGR